VTAITEKRVGATRRSVLFIGVGQIDQRLRLFWCNHCRSDFPRSVPAPAPASAAPHVSPAGAPRPEGSSKCHHSVLQKFVGTVLRKGATMTDRRTIAELPWVALYSTTVAALILFWAS
jgi:hypothetical protein